jgi:hypothetical protein
MKICLCGSARFEKEFHEWNKQLTLAGHVVYGLAVYPSSEGGNKDWYDSNTKVTLDLVHLAKIEESDAVVVVCPGGYVGESTTREIQWARIRLKPIYWTVLTPADAPTSKGADSLMMMGLGL